MQHHTHQEVPTFCSLEPRAWQIALCVSLGSALGCAGGCSDESRPEPRSRTEGVLVSTPPASVAPPAIDAGVTVERELDPVADAGADAAAPWPGPFFTVLSSSTGIYAQPNAD